MAKPALSAASLALVAHYESFGFRVRIFDAEDFAGAIGAVGRT